jgi:hypothetical protein
MSARDDEGEVGRNFRFQIENLRIEEGREQVAFHVVDGKEGLACGGGKGLGHAVSDEEGGSEARSPGGGKGLQVAGGELGFGEGLFNQRAELESMVARGDLRNDSAVGTVELNLRGDEGGEEFGGSLLVTQDGDGGFVAGGFQRQNGGGSIQYSVFGIQCSDWG